MFSDSQQELEEKHKLLVETSHNLQETQCSLALTQQVSNKYLIHHVTLSDRIWS